MSVSLASFLGFYLENCFAPGQSTAVGRGPGPGRAVRITETEVPPTVGTGPDRGRAVLITETGVLPAAGTGPGLERGGTVGEEGRRGDVRRETRNIRGGWCQISLSACTVTATVNSSVVMKSFLK